MANTDAEKLLAALQPGDPVLTAFIRAAARRAFWFTGLLFASIAFVAVVGVAQAAGIRPWDREWEAQALLAAFFATLAAMILTLVMWSIRHVEMHRALQLLLHPERRSDGEAGPK